MSSSLKVEGSMAGGSAGEVARRGGDTDPDREE